MSDKPLFGAHGVGKKKGDIHRTTRKRAEIIQRFADLSPEAVLEQIARGALYDPGRLFDENNQLKPMHELSEADRAMIQSIDVVRENVRGGDGHSDTVVKIRLVDRSRYVELAAKYHGMLVEKIELGASSELLERLDRGRLRAAGAMPALEAAIVEGEKVN